MKLIEIIKSSFTTLKMNGRRTFLTMFGIIIGIAAVITIISLGNGFKKQTLDSLAKDEKGRPSQSFNFMPNNEVDWLKVNPYDDKLIEELMEIDGVDEVQIPDYQEEGLNYRTATFANKPSQTVGIKQTEITEEMVIIGRNLMKEDSEAYKRNIIISEEVAFMFFDSIADAIHQSIKIDSDSFTIVGVFQAAMPTDLDSNMPYYMNSNPQLYMPKKTYDLFNPYPSIKFDLQVFYKPDANISQLSRQIGNYLKENGPEKDNGTYSYFDTSEMMAEIGNQLNMITYFISSIASISLFIAGVGVMNMMYISVSERTKEIGIRRSMGATKNSIQLQFLLEGISITTLGGFIGYGLGVVIANSVSNFIPFSAVIDLPTALVSVVISVSIGIVFSVFPAKAAARKNVVEILR